MKKLNALDNMFLLMDRPDQKMHIVAYAVFEKPTDAADACVQKLVEDMRRNPWPLPITTKNCIARSEPWDATIGWRRGTWT